jgi:hypothetical protein
MPKYIKNQEPSKPIDPMTEDDTQGNQFILDVEANRAIARGREKEIQRNLRTESKRPFFRRGR